MSIFSEEFRQSLAKWILICVIVFAIGYIVKNYPPAWEYAKVIISAAGDVWDTIRRTFHIR